MALFRVMITVLFMSVFTSQALAEQVPEAQTEQVPEVKTGSLSAAQALADSRQYEKAEAMLKGLISSEPKEAAYRQLLGDVYRNSGRYNEALAEYNAARALGLENSEVHKKIGTTHKWSRDYSAAVRSFEKALELNPGDIEAAEDLATVKRAAGLSVMVSTGGWEPDYTTDSIEAVVSYGGFKNLTLNAGYGYADQIYYERTKLFASGYYFYNPNSYFKVYAARKDYDYPSGATQPQPDTNAYDIVPTFEAEVSHWVNPSLRATVAYEYFRPSFFHDPDSTVNNHKVSGELYYLTSVEGLRLKAIAAFLRDPDPDKSQVKRADDPSTPLVNEFVATTAITYQTQGLFGGAVEYSKDRWSAEVKYLPNRDLDSSYSWSVLAGFAYDITDRVTGRLDYVHDKYSNQSNFAGQTADVYMASAYYALSPSVDLGAGVKRIELPNQDKNAWFITFKYRTGLVF